MTEMKTWVVTNSWGTEVGRVDLPVEWSDAIEEFRELVHRAAYSDGTYDESCVREDY